MSTKRERSSGSWEFIFRNKLLGKDSVSVTFKTEREGDDASVNAEALLAQGIIPVFLMKKQIRIETFPSAVAAYKEDCGLKNSEKLLIDLAATEHFKLRLCEMNHLWIKMWVKELKLVKKLAPSTIRHKVGAIARCLDWCVREGHLGINPLRSLPVGYASYSERDADKTDGGREDIERDRRLEEGEEPAIRKILAGAKPEGRQRPLELEHGYALSMMFDLALESAMRMREMYTLTIDQIYFEKNTIFLDKTKNGDKRQVPMTSISKDYLFWYIEAERPAITKRGGLLFPWLWEELWGIVKNSRRSSMFVPGVMTKQTLPRVTSRLSRQYVRIFESAGCLDLTFHDLRHEATSRIYERTNFPDIKIARITGHKTLNTLKRYANLRGSDAADGMW